MQLASSSHRGFQLSGEVALIRPNHDDDESAAPGSVAQDPDRVLAGPGHDPRPGHRHRPVAGPVR